LKKKKSVCRNLSPHISICSEHTTLHLHEGRQNFAQCNRAAYATLTLLVRPPAKVPVK
jgi:hypothetical protein